MDLDATTDIHSVRHALGRHDRMVPELRHCSECYIDWRARSPPRTPTLRNAAARGANGDGHGDSAGNTNNTMFSRADSTRATPSAVNAANFIGGGVAAAVTNLVVFPIDTVKTRLTAGPTASAASAMPKPNMGSPLAATRDMLAGGKNSMSTHTGYAPSTSSSSSLASGYSLDNAVVRKASGSRYLNEIRSNVSSDYIASRFRAERRVARQAGDQSSMLNWTRRSMFGGGGVSASSWLSRSMLWTYSPLLSYSPYAVPAHLDPLSYPFRGAVQSATATMRGGLTRAHEAVRGNGNWNHAATRTSYSGLGTLVRNNGGQGGGYGFGGLFSGVTSIYRGLGTNLLGAIPGKGIFIGSYEAAKSGIDETARSSGIVGLSPRIRDMGATLLWATAALSYETPFEVRKQRLQAQAVGAAKSDVVSYRGMSAFLARDVAFKFLLYPTYDELKRLCRANRPDPVTGKYNLDREITSNEALLCGFIGPLIPGFITAPLDVIKTRMMVDKTLIPAKGSGVKSGIMDVGRHIVRTEGVKGLYRGGVPRTVLLVSAGCIFFPTYEFTRSAVLSAAAAGDDRASA